jgi:diguanylate cyclase (GGDEF)-like protein
MMGGRKNMPGKAGIASRWATFLLGPAYVRRVWWLTFGMVAVGALIIQIGVDADRWPGASPVLPWWAFAAIVAVIEYPLIHLHLRSQTHSFTLGELALCLGLFLLPPDQFIVAAVLGATLAKLRLPPVKLAFNVSLWVLQVAVAAAMFSAIADPTDPFNARGVSATFLTMIVVGLIGIAAVSGAIGLVQGGIGGRSVVSGGVIGLAVNVANSGLGVIAAYLTLNDPHLVVALVGPVAVLFLAYRAFIVERQEHQRLQVVYTATRSILEAPDIGHAISSVLTQAREVFRSEIAQIVLFPERPGEPIVVRTVGPDGDDVRVSSVRTLDNTFYAAVAVTRRSELVTADRVSDLGAMVDCDGVSVRDVLVAPLEGERRVVGAIAVINNRFEDTNPFDTSDLRLLETLAGHAGVAIGNGRLERMLDELTALQAELAERATHDALTGLANRAHFTASLDAALAERGGADVGLIYVDLDDFKIVNDTFGHAAGDHTLRELAARLRSCMRENDLAGRLGGDEFAVLLTGVGDVEQLARLSDRIQSALERPISWQGVTLDPRVSLGVTHAAGHTNADALLSDGDTAMYHAKRSGKGRAAIYDVAMRDATQSRTDLIRDISHAVDAGELVLHYQPIVGLVDRRVVAVEALVRWDRPGWGLLSPGAFMPVAEEAGLAPAIGDWVVRTACTQVARWRAAGLSEPGLSISVNVSPAQLADPEIVVKVLDATESAGIAPQSLMLEVTEQVLTVDGDPRREALAVLRSRGVRVVLDDFGTGMSSLAQLGGYPVDILKVPGAFVSSDGGDRPGLADALITIGRTVDIPTIAEMIETPEQVARLERLGCEYAQGHAIATAMPAAECELWLLAGRASARPRPVG